METHEDRTGDSSRMRVCGHEKATEYGLGKRGGNKPIAAPGATGRPIGK